MKKKVIIISLISVIILAVLFLVIALRPETSKTENEITQSENSLYDKTLDFLDREFHRVYDPHYDIQSLTISNWKEDGNEATFFYTMTFLYYNRDPDTVEYIQKAKEKSQESYETLYNDYLEEKDANYEFKVILNGDDLELYSNVSPKGTEWAPVKIDDYVLSNQE